MSILYYDMNGASLHLDNARTRAKRPPATYARIIITIVLSCETSRAPVCFGSLCSSMLSTLCVTALALAVHAQAGVEDVAVSALCATRHD